MTETYYDVLGVRSDASAEEIEQAYRETLKETHPDVSDDADASDRTKELIEAKEVLTDETERARYDRLGHEAYVEGDGAAATAWEWDSGAEPPNGRSGSQSNPGDATGQSNPGDTGDQSGPRADVSSTSGAGSSESGGTATAESGAATDPGPGAEATADAGFDVGEAGYDFDEAEQQRRERANVGEPEWSGHREADPGTNRAWNPDSPYAVHRTEDGIESSRFFPTGASIPILVATFLTYPILLWGALFPAFPLAVNLVIGGFALAVVAYLQSMPEAGIVVFGAWTVLGPIALLGFGVGLGTLTGLALFAATALPLGLSALTRAALR